MSTPKNETAAADASTRATIDRSGNKVAASPPHTPSRDVSGSAAEPTSEELLAMLPPKQAEVVATFMKHGVEPPSYAELMEPNSTHVLEEMRGESFIPGCPNAECDLLDDLLHDLVEEHMSEADEGASQCKERGGFMEEEGSSVEIPDVNAHQHIDEQPCILLNTQEALDESFVEQECPKTATHHIQNAQEETSDEVTRREQREQTPICLGKRRRNSTPGADDIREIYPPLKRHCQEQRSIEPPVTTKPSSTEPEQQPISSTQRRDYTQAPFAPRFPAVPNITSQTPVQSNPSHLGKRHLDSAPAFDDPIKIGPPRKKYRKGSTAVFSTPNYESSPQRSSCRHMADLRPRENVRAPSGSQVLINPLNPRLKGLQPQPPLFQQPEISATQTQVPVQHLGEGAQNHSPTVHPDQMVRRPSAEALLDGYSMNPVQKQTQHPSVHQAHHKPSVGGRQTAPTKQPGLNGLDQENTAWAPRLEIFPVDQGQEHMQFEQQPRSTSQSAVDPHDSRQDARSPSRRMSRIPDRNDIGAPHARLHGQAPWNGKSSPLEKWTQSPSRPWSFVPLLPEQSFYPFPRATNRVPTQQPGTRLHSSQHQCRPPQQTMVGHPPLTPGIARTQLSYDDWAADAQHLAPPLSTSMQVIPRTPAQSRLKAPSKPFISSMSGVSNMNPSLIPLSSQKRESVSSVENVAVEDEHCINLKRQRVESPAVSTAAKPNGVVKPRQSSGFKGTRSRAILAKQHSPAHTATSPINESFDVPRSAPINTHLGPSTKDSPIEIDDPQPEELEIATRASLTTAKPPVSEQRRSEPLEKKSVEAVINDWNQDKPYENEDELDSWIASQLDDDLDPDAQTTSDSKTSREAHSPVAPPAPLPQPIYTGFRDRRPVTSQDQYDVSDAISHTFKDLQNKIGGNFEFTSTDKPKDGIEYNTAVESYGYQYSRLQKFWADHLMKDIDLSTMKTKRKSKKQKQAERKITLLYEVDGPWRTGFNDWKATDAPIDPKTGKPHGPLQGRS